MEGSQDVRDPSFFRWNAVSSTDDAAGAQRCGLLRLPQAAAFRFAVNYFQAGYQEQINDFEALALREHNDRSSTWRMCQEFRVRNFERPSVGQMQPERTKWLGLINFAKLFDCHTEIILRGPSRNNAWKRSHGVIEMRTETRRSAHLAELGCLCRTESLAHFCRVLLALSRPPSIVRRS